ncbi:MAG: sugar ABC transporter substrate-binding protein [Armatimonadetes bacterium]|nr:sugar ABC transporter substrate-binding protein [Armatimonadota bacterium]
MGKMTDRTSRMSRTCWTGCAAVLTVCLLLAGCSSRKQSEIHIKWWVFPMWNGITGNEKNATPEDWPRLKIREFEATHPDVKIDLEVLTWQAGSQKLDLAVLSETYPDICYLAAVNLRKYADQGVLEPIDPYLTEADETDVYPNVMDLCRYQGKTYLWPWLCNALVMAINTDIFKERGIEHLIPKPPERSWAYDQFLEAAKACTFDRNGDGKTDVYGYALYGIPLSVEYQMLTLVQGFGGQLYSPDGAKFTLNSPEGVRGMQFLMDLLDKYKVVPPGPAGTQSGQVGQMFMNQETAMISSVSGVIKSIKQSAARGEFPLFNAILVQPPHLPGKKPASLLSVGGYVVFKQEDKRKRDMTMEFARFLTNRENCRALSVIGQLPARKSAGDIYPGDEDMAVVAGLLPVAHEYFTAAGPELGQVVNNIYQQIFTHSKTPAEALADAERRANEIIARERRERGPAK